MEDSKKKNLEGAKIENYFEAGCLYIKEIQHVENLYPGSIKQLTGKDDVKTDVESQHPSLYEKQELPYNALEQALMVVGSMVEDNTIVDKKEHAALCRIIMEQINKEITTADYCTLLALYTQLPEEKRPSNEDIRKVSFSKNHLFPDWKITNFSPTKTLRYVSLAREFLKRNMVSISRN